MTVRSSLFIFAIWISQIQELDAIELQIPNDVVDLDSNTVQSYLPAGKGLTDVTSLTISNSVTRIGNRACYGMDKLTSLTIPDSVTIIEEFAFFNMHKLTSLTIPSSVTTIGNGVFFGMGKLTSLTIPSSVTTIGVNAFMNMNKLTSLTFQGGPDSIGGGAFAGMQELTSLSLSEDFIANTLDKNVDPPWILPDDVDQLQTLDLPLRMTWAHVKNVITSPIFSETNINNIQTTNMQIHASNSSSVECESIKKFYDELNCCSSGV